MAMQCFVVRSYAAERIIALHPIGTTIGVEIEVESLEGRISVRLPEVINDATRRLVYSETNLKSVQWKHLPHGAIASSWRQAGLGAYEITASPETDGILIDWQFTNLSQELWTDAAGNICMRSDGLPGVFDPEGARTFLRKGQRWHATAGMEGGLGSTWYLPPGKGPLDIMLPHIKNGDWKVASFHPDEALVAVQSKDRAWVIGQGWKKARYLIVNVRSKYACTEASPAFGDVAPGATIKAVGKIYVMRSSLDHLASIYASDLRAGRIILKRIPTSKGIVQKATLDR
jgi:hypothetical protein